MITERDAATIMRSWLSEGPTELPERVLDELLVQLPLTGQRRPRPVLVWLAELLTPVRVAAAGAVLVLTVAVAVGMLRPDGRTMGPAVTPDGSPAPSATAAPELAPPEDADAYVRAAYERLPDLPPLSLTVVEEGGTKARYAYDGSGTLRHDHFSNATNDTPTEYFLFGNDTRGELDRGTGMRIWVVVPGQGHPLAELAFSLGFQRSCAAGWRYVGLETLLDRSTHHVACGDGGMWLDAETGLPLRSVQAQEVGIGPTIVRDVTELRIGPQPAELFQPPSDVRVMSEAEYLCAARPPCASPAPVPSDRPLATPPPFGDGRPDGVDPAAIVASALATLDSPPGLAMATLDGSGARTWYYAGGRGRSRVDHGTEPTLHDPAELLLIDGHLYERGRDDRMVDVGPTTRGSLIPDWGLRDGCPTGWRYLGLDRVLERPAHHVACDRDHFWIDREWSLVTRHQRDPDALEYASVVHEVMRVRLLPPAPEFLALPSDEGPAAPAGSGPSLAWSQVPLEARTPVIAWVGDRFLLLDRATGVASASPDGTTWAPIATDDPDRGYLEVVSAGGMTASWGDALIDWDASSIRARVPPGGPTVTSDFTGDIGAAGIGPAGIVARVHSGIDFDAFVTTFLGTDWVGHLTRFEFVDGVLHVATDDGRTADIVMADHDLGPGDVADRGYGWFSPDGETWEPIPGFPPNVSTIVGVADGFVARGEAMWHSTDGMTWRSIEGPPIGDDSLLPWLEGAVEVGPTGALVLWTADGGRPLAVPSNALPFGYRSSIQLGAGPLGLVAIDSADVSFVSADQGWHRGRLRPSMYASGGGWRPPSIVVGADAVLVIMWSQDLAPSLWAGTLP